VTALVNKAGVAFLSWVRRGIATRIMGTPSTRPEVDVTVTLTGISPNPTATLKLVTPGEVIGFDTRAISRVWPQPDATDGETNFFPLLELHEADLPWRYTPAGATSGETVPVPPAEQDRLQPWICLIVLDMDAAEGAYTPPASAKGLGRIDINPDVPMPLLSQAWAWAHAQLAGIEMEESEPPVHPPTVQVTAEMISDKLTAAPSTPPEKPNRPHDVIARLMCPRRLDPLTHYTAFLVPTFKQGVDAGLGVPSAAAVQDPAWTGSTSGTGLTLPVYYKWSFRTGDGGDFESLVRALKPTPLPETLGLRDMDVSAPGGGLPPATTHPLAVEGALKSPATRPSDWPSTDRDAFASALSAMINSPADVVAPPIYGRWPASRHQVLRDTPLPFWRRHGRWPAKSTKLAENDPPVWLQTLNQDPRNRVAAALGTQVIQKDQRQLMASAWQQLGAIRDINALLRKAQLAREVSLKLHGRYLAPLSSDQKLFFTKAVHGRVKQGSWTVLQLARNAPPRQALLSSAWRRFARPLGALGRRLGKPDKPFSLVLTNVNAGRWRADAGQPAPTDLPTHGWLASLSTRSGPVRFIPDRRGAFEGYETWKGTPSEAEIMSAPAVPGALAWDPIFDPKPQSWQTGDPGPDPPASDSASMARFRIAAAAFAARTPTFEAGLALQPLAIGTIATTLTTALNPVTAIPAAMGPRVVKAVGFVFSPADPIEPIMAYPQFHQPMSKPLAEISQDWILPGLNDVPPSSVSLALTNTPFIEAYMVGLSHEMARELLWNEYPTDQKGTYFRQFWDPGGFVKSSEGLLDDADREELRDITEIHTWSRASALGAHKPSGNAAQVVLMVRGDLFRRYPGTSVYAVEATWTDPPGEDPPGLYPLDDEGEDPSQHVYPVFSGRLSPDICFFGFNLTEPQVRGTSSPGDYGYFFCFQEQPGEPRFGLDATASETPPTEWNAVAWPHLEPPPVTSPPPSSVPLWMMGGFRTRVTVPAGGEESGGGSSGPTITYIDLDAVEPDTGHISMPVDEQPEGDAARWHAAVPAGQAGARGSDLAYITFRRPLRILIHALEMLP
jgi:hypothetical protein